MLSTLYADRPEGAASERDFGVGYYRKRVAADGVEVDQRRYAPFGDDPLLLDDVDDPQHGDAPQKRLVVRVLGRQPVQPGDGLAQHRPGAAALDAAAPHAVRRSRPPRPRATREPLTIFAAALRGPVDGYETSVGAFFGAGTRAAPAAVAADKLGGTIAAPRADGAAGDQLFALPRAAARCAPGESVTLRYAYGLAHADADPAARREVRRRARPVRGQRARVGALAAAGRLRRGQRAGSRASSQWDAYLLRSASVYEEACGAPHDHAGRLLPVRHRREPRLPQLAALPAADRPTPSPSWRARSCATRSSWQPRGRAAQPEPVRHRPAVHALRPRHAPTTSTSGCCSPPREYGLGTRDTKFFDEQLPYYGTCGTATAWQHIKDAFAPPGVAARPARRLHHGRDRRLDRLLDRAPADDRVEARAPPSSPTPTRSWPSSPTCAATAASPRSCARRGAETWRRSRARVDRPRLVLARLLAAPTRSARGVIFEEPQPWAILAGAPTPAQAKTLVANIRRFLDGYGAPGAARPRSARRMSPSRARPRRDRSARDGHAAGSASRTRSRRVQWPGGVWFDLNGHLTWASASLDGVVPHARELAWDEYTRNTLATHAALWPDHWHGHDLGRRRLPRASTRPARAVRHRPVRRLRRPDHRAADVDGHGRDPARRRHADARRLPHRAASAVRAFSLRPAAGRRGGEPGRLRGYVTPHIDGPVRVSVALPDSGRTAWS